MKKSFIYGVSVSGENFTDRVEETRRLAMDFENGVNVILISPRRMGKTSLVKKVQNQISNPKIKVVYMDIYDCRSEYDFYNKFATTILKETSGKMELFLDNVKQFLTRISPKISFSPDPNMDYSVSLGITPKEYSPEYILNLPERIASQMGIHIVVCIDEFQQIGTYEETNVEALLRTKIQQCKQTMFIYAGSKRHLMSNMFHSSSKPFYQSAISMGLEPIPLSVYVDFAERLFEERGKHVSRQLVEQVYVMFDGCTWFVQMMMNELFALTGHDELCDVEKLEEARFNVIQLQEASYKDLLSRLAPKQKLLLQAIAKERLVKGITSSAFIKKYNLSSASSVQAALKPLLKNDIVTQNEDAYRVYDYFFSEWLASSY